MSGNNRKHCGIDDLNLSTRTRNALLRAGIQTVEQLNDMTPVELYRVRGIGENAITELGEVLKRPDVIARAYVECPTEEEEQITLFNWANMQIGKYPELRMMFHIPNEGKRSVVAGKHMKAAGMRKGVSDIFLSCARGGKHGLYIEMKRIKDSRVSDEQKDWMRDAAAEGYATHVAYGWQEAAEIITNYLEGGKF